MDFEGFQQFVGWLGILLLALLTARGVQQGLFRVYGRFYAYAGYVLLSSVAALVIPARVAQWYPAFYWGSELVALILGLSLTLDMFQQAFVSSYGIRKFARGITSGLVLLAISRLIVGLSLRHSALIINLDRDLRTIQSLMLVCLVALVLYYGVPLSRNLAGMLVGYGLFVSTNLFNLALRSRLGPSYQGLWTFLQPLEYCGCTLVWVLSLWSFSPVVREPAMEHDPYSHTEAQLTRLRQYLSEGAF